MATDSLYRAGLKADGEPVISAHFMHSQALDAGLRLYDDSEFRRESMVLPVSCLSGELLPLLKARCREVAELRSEAAVKRAGAKATVTTAILELLLDRWFRKGPRVNVCPVHLCAQIDRAIATRQPVRLVAPLFPFKKDSPLKTRGVHACMAEVDVLCRLAEMTQAISIIRNHFGARSASGVEAQFLVLGDGHRFSLALNGYPERITRYQREIEAWVEALGFSGAIDVVDYETFVRGRLTRTEAAQREGLRLAARELYESRLSRLLDPADMEATLKRAVAADPLPDSSNEEGRFVPLFKSVLYTYQYDFLRDYCVRHGMDFAPLYRRVMSQAFAPSPQFTPEDYHRVYVYVHGTSQERPEDGAIVEYLRRQVLRAAWSATISYLAVVKMDRDMLGDPVATLLPDHIRFTIHAKPGQIGLRTTTSTQQAAIVQPWHGVSLLRPDGEGRLKFDIVSRLQAEGMRARPVVLSEGECGGCPSADLPVKAMGATGQPLFYVHPAIEAGSCAALMGLMAEKLTRRVS